MNRAIFLATTALISASALVPAAAQVDEIIVTSTKREQTLQEVPVAVSVIQETTIQEAQINDILDLQSIVPSLRVSQLERASNTTFIIRGFGNGANNPGIEPSVAVYVDGVFRTRVGSSLQDFLDLERVEVLKGPQSTLFGKNASSGVVSIVTKKPEYEWSGAVEGTLGNYNQAIAKAYITGPINDVWAFSIAASGQRRDGYALNVAEGGDYNDRDRYAIRGQLLAQPTDNFEVRIIADYDEIRKEINEFVDARGVQPNELERIVNSNMRELPGQFETAGDVLGGLVNIVRYNRPDNYYETRAQFFSKLSAAELDAEARRNLDEGDMVYIVVGDAKVVEPQLESLGLKVEVIEPQE